MQQFSGKPGINMLLEELKTMRNYHNDENMILIEVLCEGVERLICLRVLPSGRGGMGCCEHVYESSHVIRSREFLDQFSGSVPSKRLRCVHACT